MPAWNELLAEFASISDLADRGKWLSEQQSHWLSEIGRLRGGRNVLLYSSGFLQKPQAPPQNLQIVHEDINGLMSVIFGMNWDRHLTVVLHTPGGVTNAAETIVSYLRSKFTHIEVIVPTLAMSAGTMISLSADRVVMGRQSQLGPIDPQMPVGAGRYVSAVAIVDQFETAKAEILANLSAAHVWAPILQSLGPALLQEAQNALAYGESMVARWLASYMFKGTPDAVTRGLRVAGHFSDASTHKSHGRRIDRDEARLQGVVIEDLEDDQDLQEAVLTAYHLTTIVFEQSPTTKLLMSATGRQWIKNWVVPDQHVSATRSPVGPAPVKPSPGGVASPLNRRQRRAAESQKGRR